MHDGRAGMHDQVYDPKTGMGAPVPLGSLQCVVPLKVVKPSKMEVLVATPK